MLDYCMEISYCKQLAATKGVTSSLWTLKLMLKFHLLVQAIGAVEPRVLSSFEKLMNSK